MIPLRRGSQALMLQKYLVTRRLQTNSAPAAPAAVDEAKNISDFFTSLGSAPADPKLQADNAATKLRLQHEFSNTLGDAQVLGRLFGDVMSRIESKKAAIDESRVRGESMIPCIQMSTILNCKDLNKFSDLVESIGTVLRDTGTFVIRNVIDEKDALQLKQSVREYINHNDGNVGFPEDNPQVYEIYWSKAQMQARQHQNMVTAMRFANNLWSFDDDVTRSIDGNIHSVDVPFCYVDRMRIRDPGDNNFALDSHMDGGSIERWKDEHYHACYKNIFNGNIDNFNGYDASHRIFANTDHYNTPTNCSVFRTFQGWLSLSHCAPQQGSLQVNPMSRESMAYVMLRPFVQQDLEFKMPSNFNGSNSNLQDLDDSDGTRNDASDDAIDAGDSYVIDAIRDDANFAGACGGKAMEINNRYHRILKDTMVSIPEVAPGDLVLWHCDTIHKVDEMNRSTTDSSVFYIPTCFDCDVNDRYGARQREHFLKGLTPPDFPQQHVEKDFVDRATVGDLTDLGKLVFKL